MMLSLTTLCLLGIFCGEGIIGHTQIYRDGVLVDVKITLQVSAPGNCKPVLSKLGRFGK